MAAPPRTRSIPLLFVRAIRLRCPSCGGGPLFQSWLRMRERCPDCGLQTERGEEGYVVGAYMFNIVAAELLWAAASLGVVLWTWPNPPWNTLLYAGGAMMLTFPLLCYPFSKSVFLAFDLVFRPAEEAEP